MVGSTGSNKNEFWLVDRTKRAVAAAGYSYVCANSFSLLMVGETSVREES